MVQKYKNIVIVCLMTTLIFGLAIWSWVKDADDFSDSERRVLAKFPEVSVEMLINGDFMDGFETYTQDQFPMRETFRTIKALSVKNLLNQSDKNDIYVADGYASKLEYPLNESMLDYATGRFSFIYETFIKDTGADVYLSIIPDKNAFLAEENGYLALDYDYLIEYVKDKTPYMEYIDITGTLELSDFYRTDTHWKQEEIVETAQVILDAMGAEAPSGYTVNTLDVPFNGVYVGQSALPLKPDTIKYLTNDTLDNCTVTSYDTGMPAGAHVYDMKAAEGRDPYEMFMSGSDALLVLENPAGEEGKELVVFRDSFGSSLSPLLVEGYSKVTLVDIRYMQSNFVGNFVEFDEGTDVLFIYSTMLLNNSGGLK